MKRKKRAETLKFRRNLARSRTSVLDESIISLQERIQEHQLKLEQAKKDGKLELVSYYEKELEDFYAYMRKKKQITER